MVFIKLYLNKSIFDFILIRFRYQIIISLIQIESDSLRFKYNSNRVYSNKTDDGFYNEIDYFLWYKFF